VEFFYYLILDTNGIPTSIYIKSPERKFTAEKKRLKKGAIWWGGSRSGEQYIFLPENPVVEEQSRLGSRRFCRS